MSKNIVDEGLVDRLWNESIMLCGSVTLNKLTLKRPLP